jgi:hypothetical protein
MFIVLLVDGAELGWSAEEDLVETIQFIDRRYLGVVTKNRNTAHYYASLMMRAMEPPLPEWDFETYPHWFPHTVNGAITDSAAQAREIILAAYNGLVDRRG